MNDHDHLRYRPPRPENARKWRGSLVLIAVFAVISAATPILLLPVPLKADTHGDYLVREGIAIHYGVIPAELLRGHPKNHPEATMHGGIPRRPHVHHLMVALFKESNLERIVDAKVTATISEIGLTGQHKTLEPFTVADALTFGNYFDMRPNTNYRVRLEIKIPGRESPVWAEFEFRHQ